MADKTSPPEGPAKSGRGLVWTLIVCGGLVILAPIVAVVAIPKIRAAQQTAQQERQLKIDRAGAANLLAYATAQVMYFKTDWNGDGKKKYAFPFTNLYVDASAGNKRHRLIDAGFSAATGPTGIPKLGYLFREPKTIGGQPIDWTRDFALCAIPAANGHRMTFIVTTDGIVYGKDLGPGTTFLDDIPADPVAAGWVEAD
jgi:hypothetical protein